MAGDADVKRRIKSVENTRQITRTMELVATSKLKKATDRVYAARPYADALEGTGSPPPYGPPDHTGGGEGGGAVAAGA